MTHFTPECFLEAHRIAFTQFEATRNNIRHFRDSGGLMGAAAQLVPVDTKALLRQLSYDAADGRHYCVLGELTAAKQFWPTTLQYMHAINGRAVLVNTAVAALKSLAQDRRFLARLGRLFGRRSGQPPLTAAEIAALLSSQLDAILLGTRALAGGCFGNTRTSPASRCSCGASSRWPAIATIPRCRSRTRRKPSRSS